MTLFARVIGSLVCGLVAVAAMWNGFHWDGETGDPIRDLQTEAVETGYAAWGNWGVDPERYGGWGNHSNRLIPVYTFGITLDSVRGEHSPYRTAEGVESLFGRVPEGTVNGAAEYFDQTGVHALQRMAREQGKKYIVLFVFDGMDWQTTQAAATYQSGGVTYEEGRGSGLAFLDYQRTETDYGYFVTAPHNKGTNWDIDAQVLRFDEELKHGGYDFARGGATPWGAPAEPTYLLGESGDPAQPYTDSSASGSSLTSGTKTYYRSINVDAEGKQTVPIARELQAEFGMAVGVVTSVPISHATPAAAYGNNVARYDYQDLTRDLIGLPSVAHREALAGVDVLIGAGYGDEMEEDEKQGVNYVPGNLYLADEDREKVDVANGGRYVVVQRASGVDGGDALAEAAERAIEGGHRLLGLFGVGLGKGSVKGSHLPFRTANGDYEPTIDVNGLKDIYTEADLAENPRLDEMTAAALAVLGKDEDGFWLMVEAGDVDWANHSNNIDDSIGAVISGDEAFQVVVDWVERHDAWEETAVIVTADHGHYLVLRDASVLAK